MRYGYFDNERREYVIDRVDVPASSSLPRTFSPMALIPCGMPSWAATVPREIPWRWSCWTG